MTWTKFDSLRRGEVVRDSWGNPIGYQWAEGNKHSYTKTYISIAVLGAALSVLMTAIGSSLTP